MNNNFFNSVDSLKILRTLSFVEGSSLLILLFIAMPLKYMAGYPQVVSVVGMLHGILFMGLVFLIFLVSNAQSWNKGLIFISLVSATVPFGMFYFDKKIKQLITASN